MNRFMRPSAPYTYPHRGSLEVTKFGVQELDAKEMVEVEGGFIPIPVMLGIWGFQAAMIAAGYGALATVKAAEMQAEPKE